MIIMRFGENNALGLKYIDIYKFQGLAVGGGLHSSPYNFCVYKMEKVHETPTRIKFYIIIILKNSEDE